MKNKSAILYWTDAAMLVLFGALAATGIVLHWVLPPGSGGRPGGHPARNELLDLSRHEWGDIHFWIAAAMVALVVVHLALHWGWIKTCALRAIRPRKCAAEVQHVHVRRRLGKLDRSGRPITVSTMYDMTAAEPTASFVRHVRPVRTFKRSA